jgi:2-amino-4-hydroxy-6-hydroxymethyldihydropteridine diphosphokinase
MENLAFLGLGSNIDPERNLKAAIRHLSTIGNINAVSSIWETAPLGFPDQPNFLNGVIALETPLTLEALSSEEIPRIERELGRVRGKNKFGPRTIDIDILLFNDFVGELGSRRIPSPEITKRPFVGIPLAEIAGDRTHPALGISFSEIASNFEIKPEEMIRRPYFKVPA